MRERSTISEAEIRGLFDAQDPLARFSHAELAGALPASEVLFSSFDSAPVAKKQYRAPRIGARRRVLIVAIAILVLALLTAAAWVYIKTRSTSAPLETSCYKSLTKDSPSVIVGSMLGESPEQACARQWQANFKEDAPPDLVTCIIEPTGATGVLPNPDHLSPSDACHLIAGSLPQGGAVYGGLTQEQVKALDADITRRIHEVSQKGCAGAQDVAAQVQAALDEVGAEDWTVDDRTSSTQRWIFADGTRSVVQVPMNASGQTCAYFAVQVAQTRVLLSNDWPKLPTEAPAASP